MSLQLTATSGGTFRTVRPGSYRMILKDVDKTEQAKYGAPDEKEDRLIWRFEIDADRHPKTIGDDGAALDIRKWTSLAMGPKSTNRAIIQALLGRDLGDGEKVTIEDLYGTACYGVLGYQKDDRGLVKKNDAGEPARNAIENFLPDEEEDDAKPVNDAKTKF